MHIQDFVRDMVNNTCPVAADAETGHQYATYDLHCTHLHVVYTKGTVLDYRIVRDTAPPPEWAGPYPFIFR